MAVPFSNTKLRVPKGFQNILECLAREVLHSQPDNIHEFAAAYFEKMLKVRSETGHDPAVHGAKLEDRNYNNEAFKKKAVDSNDPQQQSAAVTIQTQFRQHSAKAEVREMREEDAATRIQAGFRGFIGREHVRALKGDEGEETAPATTTAAAAEEEEVDIDLNDPEVEKAAIKIQAGFKGFKARKEVSGTDDSEKAARPASVEKQSSEQEQQVKPEAEEDEVDIDLNDPEVAAAALRIQSGFRGYQTRRDVLSQKAEKEESRQEESPKPEVQPESQSETTPEPVQQEVDQSAPEEEEIDIDLGDPEVEKAAVKIQAGFKGLKARKTLKKKAEESPAGDSSDAPKPAEDTPPEAAPAAESAPAEEEIDIDLEDPATEKAALKIQAGFRGFKTRKDMGDNKAKEGEEKGEEKKEEEKKEEEKKEDVKKEEEKKEEEEVVDIDLEDPDVAKAALKIQAGFKGFKARKEVEAKKGGSDETDSSNNAKPGTETASSAAAPAAAEDAGSSVKAEEEEETTPKVVEGASNEEGKEGE